MIFTKIGIEAVQHVIEAVQHVIEAVQHVIEAVQHVIEAVQHVIEAVQHVIEAVQHVIEAVQHVTLQDESCELERLILFNYLQRHLHFLSMMKVFFCNVVCT